MLRIVSTFLTGLIFLVAACSKSSDPGPGNTTPPSSTTTTSPPSSTITTPVTSTTAASNVTVSTVAGSGTSGYNDAVGKAALFNNPTALVADLSDNLYVIDYNNGRIRLVKPDGTVSTIAGNGLVGHVDGTGTGAVFNFLGGCKLARDPQNNVVIAELNYIRKMTPAGVVSTIASNAGSATSDFYYGIAASPAGDYYLTDERNNQIRLLKNGAFTVLTGSTKGYADGTLSTALFDTPYTLTFDGDGNLYVADQNYCIRKITPAGSVSLLAGQKGVAGHSDGKGAAATFKTIYDMVSDKQGNLYITDEYTVRKITRDGTVTTIAGSSRAGYVDGSGTDARFLMPKSITIDSKGNLYITDTSNHVIRKITF